MTHMIATAKNVKQLYESKNVLVRNTNAIEMGCYIDEICAEIHPDTMIVQSSFLEN